ncbi:MAG: glycosyltransferase family 4 protein [Chloroflexaceae bacterium]|nr:glycosyltransferase family 4 protein [Chloroflexaceae bacterium]
MRIGIDVRYLSHGLVGGVHTYIKHVVPALCSLVAEHTVVLYADTKCPFELHNLPANVTVRLLPWRNAASSVGLDVWGLRQAMEQDGIEVAHFPANYGFGPRNGRTVVTLHDAMTLMPLSHVFRSKGTRQTPRVAAMTLYLHLCSHAALRGAYMLLTVSEHAKRDILRYCRFRPERIVPVPHAPTPDLRRVSDTTTLADVRQRYSLEKPFVLADGLKNPAAVVRAWRRLPASLRSSHQIVFFSRREPLPIVAEAVHEGIARLLLRPSREDLIALYSMAKAFVFPSWLEGFGIPLLEAMTCGAPVICADNSALPEVASTAALYANAEDDAQIARHLESVLSDPAQAQQLRELGFARAAQFSWASSARQILAVYQQALHGGQPGLLARQPS